MVAAVDIIEYGCPRNATGCVIAHKEVVDAPTHVSLAGAHAVAPPAVGIRSIGIELTEAVREAGVQKAREALALLVRKTGVLVVGVGVSEVYLLVRDIEVPAAHDRLLFGESGQEATVALVPQHALVEASQTVLRVRRVDIHEPVACEL